jgi:phospholipase C
MSQGLDNLKHIVVLMMENRSFDHMLGGLKKNFPAINGLTGNESNPDGSGAVVKVSPTASYQGQLDHDPDHHFPGVDLQIFGGDMSPNRVANMQGFIKSYATQGTSVQGSHAIMNYFPPNKVPVLTTLATEYAVFNGWFASIPGPTVCNRAFAHYGTSFGNVDMNLFYITDPILSIYERMLNAGHTAKIYYYDQQSSTMEIVNLLNNQPRLFGTYAQFVADCNSDTLPDYCFIEPNYTDHPGSGGGELLASDQHPDHNVKAGEQFIALVYNAIRTNPKIWETTALLIVYDEHGGLYDHVVPPGCTPDGYVASAAATGTGMPFAFDRLGIRVPAVLISPYIAKGTVVPGTEDARNQQIFEHACIPATVTEHFLGSYAKRTDREKKANTFLDLLGDTLRSDDDCVYFNLKG